MDNAIGLSRTECECFDVPTNESLSGLYIDELDGLDLRLAESAVDCSSGTLWDFLKRAREQSIMAFKSDYASAISLQWRMSRTPFKGQIGKEKATKDYAINNFAGQRYIFKPIKNGFFKVTRIGLLFNTTGVINIDIYNNVDEDPIYSYTNVPTVANKLTWYTLPEALNLPMFSEQQDCLQYFFLYEKNGFNPRHNIINCATCTGYSLDFNSNYPVDLKLTNDARLQFTKWCNVTGVTGATVESIIESTTGFVDNAMGLVIDGAMSCQNNSIPCNDIEYEHSDIAKVMAYAIWYRAGMSLCDSILSSSNINRYTMLDRERLYTKKNGYKREYENRISWLVNPENEQVKQFLLQTGCLECIKNIQFISML